MSVSASASASVSMCKRVYNNKLSTKCYSHVGYIGRLLHIVEICAIVTRRQQHPGMYLHVRALHITTIHCKALHERRQWRQWFLYFFGKFFPSYSSFHFLIQPSLNVTEPRCKTTSAIFSFSLQTTKRNIGWKKSVFVVVDKLFIQVQRAYTTGVPNQQNL